MSRQYQDPPYANPPQQPGQFLQPLPNTYNDHPGQQAYSPYPEGSLQSQPSGQRHRGRSPYAGNVSFPEDSLQPQPSGQRHRGRSPYAGNVPFPEDSLQPQPSGQRHRGRSPYAGNVPFPEGSLQPQPSGQRHGSRSPYAGNVPFPEPQRGSSASHPQPYFPPSQTTQNLTVGTHHHHQHERQSSHGHSPSIGSSSDSQRLYPPAGAVSDTGGGSNFYSQPAVQTHHGGGYPATAAQPQDRNATVYEGHDSRTKAPPYRPANMTNPLCRYPRCNRLAFFDRRINELREWCSDQHMHDAIRHGVERPCNTCRVWPRRNGRRHCSDICRSQQN